MRTILPVLVLLFAANVQAQEWNRFRGPNGGGVSGVAFPTKWTDNDYLWTAELPGKGNSSPVVWRDHVYVTSADKKSGMRFVLALSVKDGKTLWRREFAEPAYKTHQRNSIATSTPTVDAERLYLAWATPQHYVVQALDRLTGKEIWKIDLGTYVSQHGFGASPILCEDLLILCNEQDNRGWLHAVDTRTGKEVWKVTRKSGNATYSAPCIYQTGDRPAEIIFTNWQHGITALDPRTGKLKWEISCFAPKLKERAIASPIIAGEYIIGTCGFVTAQKHFVAVQPNAEGKVKEVWRIEKAVAYLPTPVVKGERIYSCTELGIFSCIDAKTGKVIWQERLDGNFSASPVCAGDAVYCTDDSGAVFVIAAADTFKLLGRSRLSGATQSTPAIAADCMIFRTENRLAALAKAKAH